MALLLFRAAGNLHHQHSARLADFCAYTPPEEEEATRGAGKRLLPAVRNPVVSMGWLLATLSLSSADIISSWLVSLIIPTWHGNAVDSGGLFGRIGGSLALAQATSWVDERAAPSPSGFSLLSTTSLLTPSLSCLSGCSLVLSSPQSSPKFQSGSDPLSSGSALGTLVVGFINSAEGLRYLP